METLWLMTWCGCLMYHQGNLSFWKLQDCFQCPLLFQWSGCWARVNHPFVLVSRDVGLWQMSVLLIIKLCEFSKSRTSVVVICGTSVPWDLSSWFSFSFISAVGIETHLQILLHIKSSCYIVFFELLGVETHRYCLPFSCRFSWVFHLHWCTSRSRDDRYE